MKVTVNNFLNVRVGKPELNAPCYQYLAPGSELEVDGELYKGDPFDGIDTWLKDAAGNYYWIGGIDHPITTQKRSEIINPQIDGKITFNWFNQLKIQDVWTQFNEKGNRAKVVVLDTGYDVNNNDFINAIKDKELIVKSDDYPGVNLLINDDSKNRHGNRCAALIGARNSLDWILGIAPECELLIGKISLNEELVNFDYIMNGIKWAINKNADIISISYSFEIANQAEITTRANELVQLVAGKNIMIFAAVGNASKPQQRAMLYPASFDSCISVGATDAANNLSDLTILNDKTVLHAPGENIESYNNKQTPSPLSGTSFATPIVAGVAALAVSFLKKKSNNNTFDKDELLRLLNSTGDFVNGSNTRRLINPIRLFNNL